MSGGATVALVLGGAAALGAGAYFLLYKQPAAPQPNVPSTYPAGYPYTALMAPTPPGAPPPAPSAATQLVSDFNSVNQAGCQAAAAKVSAGLANVDSLGAIGCSAFLKYATPWGVANLVNTEVQKIPVVGPAVGKVEHAVSNVVSAPINAVKGTVSKVLSFL